MKQIRAKFIGPKKIRKQLGLEKGKTYELILRDVDNTGISIVGKNKFFGAFKVDILYKSKFVNSIAYFGIDTLLSNWNILLDKSKKSFSSYPAQLSTPRNTIFNKIDLDNITIEIVGRTYFIDVMAENTITGAKVFKEFWIRDFGPGETIDTIVASMANEVKEKSDKVNLFI